MLLEGLICFALYPVVKSICENDSDDSPSGEEPRSHLSVECDGYYSEREESSSGERQTTLIEYGFGE